MGDVQAIAAMSSAVERVCTLLTTPSPETLERCERVLESAATSYAGLRLERADRPAVEELQSALALAGRLLESAFQYHEQWRRRLGASLAGYQPGGDPAAVVHPSRVTLKG
jgi:hypothetical protein